MNGRMFLCSALGSSEEAKLSQMTDRDQCWFEWMNLVGARVSFPIHLFFFCLPYFFRLSHSRCVQVQSMSVRKFSELGFELVDVPEVVADRLPWAFRL